MSQTRTRFPWILLFVLVCLPAFGDAPRRVRIAEFEGRRLEAIGKLKGLRLRSSYRIVGGER